MDARVFPLKRTFMGRFGYSMEALTEIKYLAAKEGITLAYFTVIGACQEATLAFYDQENKEYLEKDFDEPLEVVSMTGNLMKKNKEIAVHAHVILGRDDGSTIAGHLISMRMFAGELFLQELDGEINRLLDEKTGLYLMDLEE
ncbi:Uncharacterised protein [uncultured archaeon]|nr:Uncharacterised protein [uncultured archaeon]